MPNSTNEVILNGRVIMSTRGNTVTENTLVQGEVAQDKTGKDITGNLDPVSHEELNELKEQVDALDEEAYKLSDEEGEISENDYIPFNDASDGNKPKKKFAFTSLIEKLKSFFATKSGDNIDDVDAFRENIHTLEWLGTDIPNNSDMNTYKTAGNYRVVSDASAQTISNLPLALCGKVIVFDNGNGGLEQFYFPNHSPRIFFRTWWSNAWSTWKELGEGGGDSEPHTYEIGTDIPANSDLNNYKTAGVYMVRGDSDATTITNIPEQMAGKLIVSYIVPSMNFIHQFYYSDTNHIYIRMYSNWNTTWTTWQDITSSGDSKPHTYDRGTAIPVNSDLDNYKTEGVYFVADTGTAETIVNIPVAGAGKLIVMDRDTGARLFQIYMVSRDEIYMRDMSNDSVFSAWRNITRQHTYETGERIPASSDLNTYTSIGVYQVRNDSDANTISNIPITYAGKLIVSQTFSDNNVKKQTYLVYNSDAIYVRTTTDNGTNWTSWKLLASTDDISPSTVGNGYAVATVSGSTITATISGFQLRAGVIVGLAFSSEVAVDCTINISSTGAKGVRYWEDQTISAGKPIKMGLNTFMYDGTYYRLISIDRTPTVHQQSYVADTSGNINIDWGYGVNRAQIKFNLASNRLLWNYRKNSAWRGDVALVDYDDLKEYFNTYCNDYGVKNIFPWDVTTDIFKNLNYTTHTLASGIVNVTVTNESTNKGVYINTQTMNTYLADFNGKSLILSCEAKFDDAQHNLSFGLDNNYADYSVGTNWTYIERTITLDTSLTNNHWHFYLQLPQNVTYHIRNLMIRPAIITSSEYEPFSLTNQQIVNGLGASVAKVGKSILSSWGYTTNVRTTNGITYTFNPTTGEITANGTATADADCVVHGGSIGNPYFIPKGSYRLSGCPSGGSTSTYFMGLNFANVTYYDVGSGAIFTLNADENGGNTRNLYIRVKSGTTVSNKVFKPMLCPSWTTADYAPSEDARKGNCYVGTCTTAGGTKDKVAYVDGYFVLRKGVTIAIKFTNTNSYSNVTSSPVTLNVNNTGAKNIWYGGTYSGAGNTGTNTTAYGRAGYTNYYVYDGTYWVWQSSSADNDGNNRKSFYGTCSTAGDQQVKVVTLADTNGWELRAGTIVGVKFSNSNTYSATADNHVQLNVNNTGAKNIYYNTGYSTGTNGTVFGVANRIHYYMYNGTDWCWMNHGLDLDTTDPRSLGFGYGTCATAEATTAKVVTLASYTLRNGGFVAVKFTYAVPANSTMNINNRGAREIWHRGAKITANKIKAGDLATFVYDGTRYQLVANDRYIT